ncbi:hypothetical protein IV494_03620 [Kaistella sp. G5-32]|uniref:Uncharacterized protein n=1 Tax=Kaistella gelatinilytica TaxID=2787636 RepID=A0ABS0F971_9FLAO|nr:hypothetical protein [Kaistella gelatinilytica]MBF8456261.1 hypothetical protein [Kaistella gelatinilytica]
MTTKPIYILIFLFLLNSCSESNSKTSTTSANDNVTTSVSEDTMNMTPQDQTVNVDQIQPEKQTEKKQENIDNPVVVNPAAPQVMLHKLNAAHDSVQVAFNKIKPELLNKHTEIINPNLSGLIKKNDETISPVEPPTETSPEPKVETPVVEEKPKNAVLGFSYFPQIPLNEERDLRVFVKIEGEGKQVAKKLKAIEKEDLEFTKTDDSSIVCIVKNIEAFKKLSIKPFYDYDDFRITKVDDGIASTNAGDVNEQILDFTNGNYWHWKVKAIAKSGHVGTVTLIIKAETPAGQTVQLAERQIKIKIGIDQPVPTFWEKIYNFLDAHFKEILSLIIIPLAVYLFNLIRKKYLAKKDEEPIQKTPETKL